MSESLNNNRLKTDYESNSSGQSNGKRGRKIYWIYLLILLGFFAFQYAFDNTPKEIPWTKFEQTMLLEHDVERLIVVNREFVEVYIHADKLGQEKYKDVQTNRWGGTNVGPHYSVMIGSIDAFERKVEELQAPTNLDQRVTIQYITRKNWFGEVAGWLIPIGLMIFLWVFITRRISGSSSSGFGSMFSFGKSKAKIMEAGKDGSKAVTFKDVAGLEEAKQEVMEVVDFLKAPDAYAKLGARIPKGVLLVGPPGTGKTLLAKAVAGEADVPVLIISGSSFVEMFVGVGASRVRDLFQKAKEKAPCIIFIDEIDAIGRTRSGTKAFGGNDERESTLNQLLSEMDGFGTNTGVIVLAATNRGDILDKALLRPGRFDRHIYLELPNRSEREAIYGVHLKKLQLADDIRVADLAAQTPGFSGADIANVCNEAALFAARAKKEQVEHSDFVAAIDRVVGGVERKSKLLSKQERKIIAYHEAGHATASWFLKYAAPLVKVTIIPRGKSLGASWFLPQERQLKISEQFLDEICVLLAGRAAEELTLGSVSSGALDDLEKATKQAYAMTALLGFNEKLGNISFHDSSGAQEGSLHKPYSEDTGKLIDEEVRNLINFCYERALKVLGRHQSQLEALAERLLEKEIVSKEELELLFGKRRQYSDHEPLTQTDED